MMIKKINKLAIYFIVMMLFNGCGLVPAGSMMHSTNTQVILSEANYRIINTVKGEATGNFVFGVGPFSGRLYARAKRNMLDNANLSGGGNKSRALINITTDIQHKYLLFLYFPFYFSKTVYLTADVIEFKDN